MYYFSYLLIMRGVEVLWAQLVNFKLEVVNVSQADGNFCRYLIFPIIMNDRSRFLQYLLPQSFKITITQSENRSLHYF